MFNNFIKTKYLITFLTSIFFSIIIFLLIYKQIIYPTIIPMIKNGIVHIFPDWSVILNANKEAFGVRAIPKYEKVKIPFRTG